jgi:hypothetical protein
MQQKHPMSQRQKRLVSREEQRLKRGNETCAQLDVALDCQPLHFIETNPTPICPFQIEGQDRPLPVRILQVMVPIDRAEFQSSGVMREGRHLLVERLTELKSMLLNRDHPTCSSQCLESIFEGWSA